MNFFPPGSVTPPFHSFPVPSFQLLRSPSDQAFFGVVRSQQTGQEQKQCLSVNVDVILCCAIFNHRKFLQLGEKCDLPVYYKGNVVIEIIADFFKACLIVGAVPLLKLSRNRGSANVKVLYLIGTNQKCGNKFSACCAYR